MQSRVGFLAHETKIIAPATKRLTRAILTADMGRDYGLGHDLPPKLDRIGHALNVMPLLEVIRLDKGQVHRIRASKLNEAD